MNKTVVFLTILALAASTGVVLSASDAAAEAGAEGLAVKPLRALPDHQLSEASSDEAGPAGMGHGAGAAAGDETKRVVGEVLETMDATGYTYVRVKTDQGEVWAAGPRTAGVDEGDTVGFDAGIEMHDFESKSLGRTFESIYFVNALLEGDAATAPPPPSPHDMREPAPPQAHVWQGSTPESVELSGIERADDGHTVGEIYTSKADLSGKKVAVRGKVVKTNLNIMGKNWLHVRDGSKGPAGSNDLTVTTDATADVGDTVVVRGKLSTDRDFGAGYHYDVIVEDAEVTVE